jgi:hypothetical protein
MMMFLSFLFGCTLTYLITVISSALKSATVLEDAMLTYALFLMSSYEVTLKQLELTILAGKMSENQANVLRRANSEEFEKFANKKIKEVLNIIPPSHTNIIRYKNFNEMKVYVTKQYRSRYAKTNKKV